MIMEAKELMIGDWVMQAQYVGIDGEGRVWKYVQIDRIPFDEDKFIAPIQLTPEILEKNGFEYMNDEYGCWVMSKVELREREPYNDFFEVEIRISEETVFLHYVHELQHALKLCKIDKEIEL